jgi:hypothetical protein
MNSVTCITQSDFRAQVPTISASWKEDQRLCSAKFSRYPAGARHLSDADPESKLVAPLHQNNKPNARTVNGLPTLSLVMTLGIIMAGARRSLPGRTIASRLQSPASTYTIPLLLIIQSLFPFVPDILRIILKRFDDLRLIFLLLA